MRAARWLIALALMGALGTGVWFGYRSEAMKLKRVEILGNSDVSADDVVDASGLRDGVHLLHLSTSSVARDIESISWIATARVERILPSKVRITVREREPAAVALVDGQQILIDREGIVLAEGSRPLPTLTGLPIQDASPGQKLALTQVRHVFAILDSLDPEIRRSLKSIDAASVDRITLILDDATQIMFGAAEDLEDKNFAAASLLRRYRAEGRSVERIDVRVPLRPAVKPR